ncbi:hypothetical protein PIL02S_00208 [Paenibacillus illinoisensis]|uniref:Uncharacterized protein n=1 Tax=Paenibacillus illinoisensis TaxID=59845 RepID=A0A2W0CFX0_9BACL|nr:hypothetical protein PIL02S_00208 [Paenibacillus illinoisensis]
MKSNMNLNEAVQHGKAIGQIGQSIWSYDPRFVR